MAFSILLIVTLIVVVYSKVSSGSLALLLQRQNLLEHVNLSGASKITFQKPMTLSDTKEVKNITFPKTKIRDLTDSAMFKDQGIKLKWISLRVNRSVHPYSKLSMHCNCYNHKSCNHYRPMTNHRMHQLFTLRKCYHWLRALLFMSLCNVIRFHAYIL